MKSEVLDRNGFTCQMCGITPGQVDPETGRPARLHVRHIVDKTLGGKDEVSNLRALCSNCNQGAKNITAVDGFPGCVRYISKTAQELEFSISPVKSDVFKFLEATPEKFDLIFADPPYDFSTEQFLKIADLVFEKQLLLDDGVLIIEHSDQSNLSEHHQFSEQRKYGGSIFSFFEIE